MSRIATRSFTSDSNRSSRWRWFASLVLLANALMLTGCFSQGPDDDSVRRILQDQIDSQGTVVEVSKIDKVNSAKQGNHWLVDVDATLTFKKSADELAQGFHDSSGGVSSLVHSLSQVGLVMKFGTFKAGQTEPYHTRLTLIKGDQGWMPLDN